MKATSTPTSGDMEKVQSTLKQLVRDWSSDGQAERDACYQPIIDEIEQHFPHDGAQPRDTVQVNPNSFYFFKSHSSSFFSISTPFFLIPMFPEYFYFWSFFSSISSDGFLMF